MTEKAKNDWVSNETKRALFWVSVEEYLGHFEDSHEAAHFACGVDTMKDFEDSLDAAIALVMTYAAKAGRDAALAGVKTIRVLYERKFNLGEWESLHLGFTAWADVPEDAHRDGVQAELWAWVKQAVKDQALPVLKAEGYRVGQTKAPTTMSQEAFEEAKAEMAQTEQPSDGASQEGVDGFHDTQYIMVGQTKAKKPQVEFWNDGRQYAEIRWALGIGRLLELAPWLRGREWSLAVVNPVDGDLVVITDPERVLSTPSDTRFSVPCRVHYKQGKPRPSGKGFYEDIVAVAPR